MPTWAATAKGYGNLWAKATILPAKRAEAERVAKKIIANRARYEAVEKATGAPWWWVAAIHYREASLNFKGCLANGELIVGTGRKTRIVPAGRGPYDTFEESCVDAIRYEGLFGLKSWMPAFACWAAEKLNGFGYVKMGVNSPYVWAGTSLQQRGLFVADGKPDRNAWDSRLGVAAIMKAIFELDPAAEPKTSAPAAPVVVSSGAVIAAPAAAFSVDPAYLIGAGAAIAIIIAHWALTEGKLKMPILTNWKTSSLGGGSLMVAVWQLAGMIMGTTPLDPATVGTVILGIIGGLMGLVAKDGNVTGETKKQ